MKVPAAQLLWKQQKKSGPIQTLSAMMRNQLELEGFKLINKLLKANKNKTQSFFKNVRMLQIQ